MCRQLGRISWAAICLAASCGLVQAEDWSAWQHDNVRSGISRETISLPLHRQWTHIPQHAPEPAWPAPAKRDIWHEIRELSPVVIYDRAFQITAAGDAVFFGSSADDQVYCLDAATGNLRWSFFTEGPVRLAPAFDGGRIYFASDDGYAYCVSAADGTLVWKYGAADRDRRLPGNGRIIAEAPARTGVVVDNGVAIFFSGLFPPDHTWLCALDAATGKAIRRESVASVSPQGYLMASSSRVFVPTGRTNPAMFDRESLTLKGMLPGSGGAYAILSEESVISGPGIKEGNKLDYADTTTGETVASFPAVRMIVDGPAVYVQAKDHVAAIDRPRYLELSRQLTQKNAAVAEAQKKLPDVTDPMELLTLGEHIATLNEELAKITADRDTCYRWKQPAANPYAMILVGGVLFTGGEGEVVARQAADGAMVWSEKLAGKVYALSAANGRVFAGTDAGVTYCFAAAETTPAEVKAAPASPWTEDPAAPEARAAAAILSRTGIQKGYCLLLGAGGDGRLAWELARQSGLQVVCAETDPAVADHVRKNLAAAGVYGACVAVHHLAGETLPYTGYCFNLVASADPMKGAAPRWPAAEVARVLQPYGGQACIGAPDAAMIAADALTAWTAGAEGFSMDMQDGVWAALSKGAVAGAGEWTQLYADAAHTACSMDQLEDPTAIQWFGRPGPRDMVDRHHRPMASLFKNGRLHITGDDKVITVDAYNGFPLWELDIPGSRRVGAMRNAGQMLLTDDVLYVTTGPECWLIDPVTGGKKAVFKAPQVDGDTHDWGDLNSAGDWLIGSGQKAEASVSTMSLDTVNNLIEGDYRPVISSHYVFVLNRHSGELLWKRQAGALINSMMAVMDDRLYLVECRGAEALQISEEKGRNPISLLLKADPWLVALDLKTGGVAWERMVQFPFEHVGYLNGRDGVLLASGSQNDGSKLFYSLFGFDAATGADRWNNTFRGLNNKGEEVAETGGSHGEQWQHPVLMGDTIYQRPYAFDLQTGVKKEYINRRGGHGCGGLTGSGRYLFGRGSNPRMYPTDVNETDGVSLTLVSRPGCWLNIIPAGGIVMAPESSSGCTCAYPMQTSLAMIPMALAGGVPRTP